MKKNIAFFLAAGLIPAFANAQNQSAINALQLTQSDFKGTARFMSMGGAFTSLGGDLSTLGQNPAGIGIYRHSEIGATLDVNAQSVKAVTPAASLNESQTKAFCNNFGYVGVARLDGAMKTFTWGVTYGRAVSFDRLTSGYGAPTMSSLSNYIAQFTTALGTPDNLLQFNNNTGFNPYFDSGSDWLSILAYTSFMINNAPGSSDSYEGLAKPNGETNGDAEITVREKGYVDEYNFTFGGNIENVVYWGLGIGVNDLNYTRLVQYSESMENAYIYNLTPGVDGGDAGFTLNNYKHLTGTGWNIKFGLIYKPINELRIGAAIHSPTWYSIDESYNANTDFSYFNPGLPQSNNNPLSGGEETEWADFSWKLQSPWRYMVGVSAVLGQKLILSLDFEQCAYGDMKVKKGLYDTYGYLIDYQEDHAVNSDIKAITRSQNTVRLGAEYRLTPSFSLRAGFNTTTSNIKKDFKDNFAQIPTAGTDPSFSLAGATTNICAGLGYRVGPFAADLAYVHTHRSSSLRAYSDFIQNRQEIFAPDFDVTASDNQFVLSLSYKF